MLGYAENISVYKKHLNLEFCQNKNVISNFLNLLLLFFMNLLQNWIHVRHEIYHLPHPLKMTIFTQIFECDGSTSQRSQFYHRSKQQQTLDPSVSPKLFAFLFQNLPTKPAIPFKKPEFLWLLSSHTIRCFRLGPQTSKRGSSNSPSPPPAARILYWNLPSLLNTLMQWSPVSDTIKYSSHWTQWTGQLKEPDSPIFLTNWPSVVKILISLLSESATIISPLASNDKPQGR